VNNDDSGAIAPAGNKNKNNNVMPRVYDLLKTAKEKQEIQFEPLGLS